VAAATIDALNVWSSFCRSYYLSLFRQARRARGGPASVGTAFVGYTDEQAMDLAIRRTKPWLPPRKSGTWARRDEPAWHDANVLLTLAAHVVASNLTQVQAAFSSGTFATTDLVIFRNYFAHRNAGTRTAAVSLASRNAVTAGRSPAAMMLEVPVGRRQPLLAEWISDLEFVAEFVCE
jgi:hypothetical protein